jgi:2-keto-4-pentenoate hydratase
VNRPDPVAEAQRILVAHDRRSTLDPISDRLALTMEDAYAIQSIVTAARLERGERVVGWKLGYTSVVMREQMGVAEANHGPLTDAMLLADGADVSGRFTQPRVEPEVALRFGRQVPAGADRAAVLDAVASAHAALEVVDSVWTNYRFRIEDNTADGSSAAGVVLGPQIRLDRIADVRVSLLVDGEVVGIGHGRDASGHPADGVVWLVEQLGASGVRLRAGDIVITGGLTSAVALTEGSEISAEFDDGIGGEVRVCVRERRTGRGSVRT